MRINITTIQEQIIIIIFFRIEYFYKINSIKISL